MFERQQPSLIVTFVGVAVLVSVRTDARNTRNTKKAVNNTKYMQYIFCLKNELFSETHHVK